MGSSKYEIIKKCAFLLNDIPPLPKKAHKTRFPSINHILAYNFASVLEPMLDFTNPDSDGKILSLLYSKMFAHTAKHLIHKYNRQGQGFYKYRMWAINDFIKNEGKIFSYVEYPRMEDLISLKREVMNRTPIKVKNLDLDQALENLNMGAFNDFHAYSMLDFQKDFELAHFFWNIMIDYMVTVREKPLEKASENSITTQSSDKLIN